jgi:hypothetical protein
MTADTVLVLAASEAATKAAAHGPGRDNSRSHGRFFARRRIAERLWSHDLRNGLCERDPQLIVTSYALPGGDRRAHLLAPIFRTAAVRRRTHRRQ